MNTVHILEEGRSVCGWPGSPNQWPSRDTWVARSDASEATCEKCLKGERWHPVYIDAIWQKQVHPDRDVSAPALVVEPSTFAFLDQFVQAAEKNECTGGATFYVAQDERRIRVTVELL